MVRGEGTRVHLWELTLGATACNGQGGGGNSCTSMGIDTGCHGVQWSGGGGRLVYIYGN